MRKINLLPKSFVQARQSRHRGIVIGSLCGILTFTLGITGYMAKTRLDSIARHITAVQNEIQTRQTRESDRIRTEAHRVKLERLLALRNVADLPLQPSVALSTVFDLQPESIVFSKIVVELPPLPPPESATVAAPAAGVRRPVETPKPLSLEIGGYAMSDLDAARFVGALSTHPAFASVMLSSSKRVDIGGIPRFQFQVRALIPSDRRYHVDSEGSAADPVAEVSR